MNHDHYRLTAAESRAYTDGTWRGGDMLGFKEWTETRKPFYWVKLFSMMPRSFQHIGLNKYEFEGQVIEFPPGDTPDTDRHQAYAYLAGYLKWCRKHDQEPGPFEDLVDSPSVEDL